MHELTASCADRPLPLIAGAFVASDSAFRRPKSDPICPNVVALLQAGHEIREAPVAGVVLNPRTRLRFPFPQCPLRPLQKAITRNPSDTVQVVQVRAPRSRTPSHPSSFAL